MLAALESYSLRDFLMFSPETFDALHVTYLQDIQPAPWVFGGLVIAGLSAVFAKKRYLNRLLVLITGVSWIWIGAVYQRVYHSQISLTANYLLYACLFQGCVILALAGGSWSEAKRPLSIRKIVALCFFAVVALSPLPGWSSLPGEGEMLYGYGPTRTYLGTIILLAISRAPLWLKCLASVIPLLAISFRVLTQVAFVLGQ